MTQDFYWNYINYLQLLYVSSQYKVKKEQASKTFKFAT